MDAEKIFLTKKVGQRYNYRMITTVCAFESLWSEVTFEYIQHGYSTSRKFSVDAWSWAIENLQAPKMDPKIQKIKENLLSEPLWTVKNTQKSLVAHVSDRRTSTKFFPRQIDLILFFFRVPPLALQSHVLK